jgi:hypothetical protein
MTVEELVLATACVVCVMAAVLAVAGAASRAGGRLIEIGAVSRLIRGRFLT